jgi:ABC-2 type transport system permease protein
MKAWVIYKRELRALAVAPITYVLGAIFLLAAGYRFSLMLIQTSRVDFYPIQFRYMTNVLLIFTPLLTMRLLAGERESGSIALLFTSPIDEWAVVLGKWGATYTVISMYLLLTMPLAAILFSVGEPDQGPIISGYLGLYLLSGTFCAIGLFASSLTTSSIVAAVIGFGINLFFGVVERLKDMSTASLGAFFEGLSYVPACRDFFGGVIYGKHVILFLSLTFFFLFATQRMLCSNRWR